MILTKHAELSTKLDLEMISEEEQEKLDGDENNHSQVCKTVNFNFWFNTVWENVYQTRQMRMER